MGYCRWNICSQKSGRLIQQPGGDSISTRVVQFLTHTASASQPSRALCCSAFRKVSVNTPCNFSQDGDGFACGLRNVNNCLTAAGNFMSKCKVRIKFQNSPRQVCHMILHPLWEKITQKRISEETQALILCCLGNHLTSRPKKKGKKKDEGCHRSHTKGYRGFQTRFN